MKLLMIGDVVSQPGCEMVRRFLPRLKRELSADVVIVNGENSAVGNGILPSSAESLLNSGADVITTGNHAFKRREIYDYFAAHEYVIRPANYHNGAPGNGVYRYDGGSYSLLVVNMQGTSFMEPLENPFDAVDRILREEEKALWYFHFSRVQQALFRGRRPLSSRADVLSSPCFRQYAHRSYFYQAYP